MTTPLEQALESARDTLLNKRMDEREMCGKVIVPLLRKLGWDDSDKSQFTDEYKIPTHRGEYEVDYALFADRAAIENNQPSLLIEAKQLGLINSKSEIQLEDYAKLKVVDVGILTDGDKWRFYLRREQLAIKDWLALEFSLKNDAIGDIAASLRKVLQREVVASGHAKRELEECYRQTGVTRLLDEAWSQLLDSSDFAEIVTAYLTTKLRKAPDIELSHRDALAFVKGKLAGGDSQGEEAQPVVHPSNGKRKRKPRKDSVIVTLTLDGKDTERITRAAAIELLVYWALDTDSDFLNKLAQTQFASKTEPPRKRDGKWDDRWLKERISGYWLKAHIGKAPMRSFINGYNRITGKGVVCSERKEG